MEDFRAAMDRDRITREQAQALWKVSRHWFLGIIYSCREDPRVIVRNRFWVGWTWNFGHPWVFPTMGAFALFALAPGGYALHLGHRKRPAPDRCYRRCHCGPRGDRSPNRIGAALTAPEMATTLTEPALRRLA